MSVTTTNLLQGPAELYIAAFGAVEPATVNTTPGTGWRAVGGTTDGLTLGIKLELSDLMADQLLDAAGAVVTGREITLETNLAEVTLDNFAQILNEPVPAAATAGERSFEPTVGVAAFVPPYCALLFDGRAPAGFRRRVILRRTLSTDGTEMAAKKEDQTVLSAAWKAYHVSDSIKPFRVVDATA